MDWGWKRSFRLEHDTRAVLGLDIGLTSVKAVRLRKEGSDYAVVSCGLAEISRNGHGQTSQREQLVAISRAIRECLDVAGARVKYAVCGVSGPDVVVRDFEFPAIPAEEIDSAVRLEASQVCPFNMDDSTVDYQLIEGGGEKIRGILVAATNALIRSKVYLTKEASLHCAVMDVDGLALLNCFTQIEGVPEGGSVAILNVGGSYTTLAIMNAEGWPFIRDMIYVGDDILKKIASARRMPPKAVRKVLSGAEPADAEFVKSLEDASTKLVADVTETLRYYNSQKRFSRIERIHVCGGFALAGGFIEILDKQLPVETVLWNPFEKIRCDMPGGHRGLLQKNILQKSGPALAVAAGLAMRSI